MIFHSAEYAKAANELHERERSIKAARGVIYDRNGVILADNKPVCTVSVIHSQITEPERVISVLCEVLELPEEKVRKRVEKVSSIERIKANVEKETADYLRSFELDGVMVDEDYKRYYPFGTLASRVIGFTGGDNQGIIGLEVKYDSLLEGIPGKILTLTTAHGTEIPNAAENRKEPIAGNSLTVSLDVNIQKYAEQAALKVLEAKSANHVSLIVMNPQNGEIYAMVNVPEFDLNDPYTLNTEYAAKAGEETLSGEKKNELLNQMWRNPCISDTYEPGSTFKIITATAAFEHNAVSLTDRFFCPGYKIVEDRTIHCHKVGGHGSESFVDGIRNSCNPVFMEIGARVGTEGMYETFEKLGLMRKTGIDLPGEASSIMHKTDNIKAVELATISFGQSFQITPIQLLSAVSTVINGGKQIVPHFGVYAKNTEENTVKTYQYEGKTGIVSEETCETMKMLLESVVHEGTGKRAYLPGFRIGGKTATSEKLPRSSNRYISSFLGFAPAENPQVIAMVMIDEPEGIYYGGTIAAPVIAEVFDSVLPYLGIEPVYSEDELKLEGVGQFSVPDMTGMTKEEVKALLKAYEFGEIYYTGEGDTVTEQFPEAGEKVNKKTSLILYTK
ncbi:MAG: penicillin-binding transpeptidase domain-containing protein [Lachnospiraceae bacterium]|nr:penicillin-binding transpeptidase domain-containing protein [Lachnospiraceae bacterium]